MKSLSALSKYVWPSKDKWRLALIRLLIIVVLLVVFRFEALAWLVAGHNLIWKAVSHSPGNNPTDLTCLTQLRAPGLRMLLRLGEPSSLAEVKDPAALPALIRIARTDSDIIARMCALDGLAGFRDHHAVEVALEGLSDPNPKIRVVSANVLSELGEEKHLPLLSAAANKESDHAAQKALHAAERTIVSLSACASTQTVKVAAVQCVSKFGEPDENRRRLISFVREAAENGAKIVVLPETAIQGYMSSDIKTGWLAPGHTPVDGVQGIPAETAAEPMQGPSTEQFCKLAKELHIYVTVPFLEIDKESGCFFNSVCLADPDGKVLLHYRKLHPWPYGEQGWASSGDRGLAVTDSPYGRLGMLICYDINFEPSRLETNGVDTLLYSIAWVDTSDSQWFETGLPHVARINNMNIIGANWTIPRHCGWHGYGRSRIISRSGKVIARADDDLKEQIVYADIPVPNR